MKGIKIMTTLTMNTYFNNVPVVSYENDMVNLLCENKAEKDLFGYKRKNRKRLLS